MLIKAYGSCIIKKSIQQIPKNISLSHLFQKHIITNNIFVHFPYFEKKKKSNNFSYPLSTYIDVQSKRSIILKAITHAKKKRDSLALYYTCEFSTSNESSINITIRELCAIDIYGRYSHVPIKNLKKRRRRRKTKFFFYVCFVGDFCNSDM